MFPKPRQDLRPNTAEFERLPFVKATGFREYDARWRYPEEINLLGLEAVGLALTDLMRERVGAQVGLLNSGAIRGNRLIPAGPITRRDIRQLLPFSNTVTLLEVTGDALHGALERSVDELPRPTGHYLQTAGVQFTVDPARPPGRRVSAVQIGGRPVVPAGLYRVAVPDYLARGRDGYPMLTASRVLLAPEDGPGLIETVLAGLAAGRSP